MKFFYKVAVIANICFVLTIIFRYVEMNREPSTNNQIIPLAPVQNLVVILGYGAIIINVLLIGVWIMMRMFKKLQKISPRMLLLIWVFLIIQIIYFIFLP